IDDLIGLKVKEVQKVVKNITDKPVQIGQLSLQPNHEARVATPKAKEDFPKLLEENSVEVIAEVPIKTEIGEGEKIAIQLIIGIFLLLTGSVLVLGGFYLGPIFNIGTISFGIIAIPVVLIAIIGAINAVNLIDGMDGLAAGIMAIASFSSIVFLFITGNIEKAMPFIILTALCLGFLVFNKRPAKIFMGDVGSFALGAGYATAVLVTDIPYFGVLALAVPIVSVIVSLIYRAGLIKLPVEPLHHTLNHYGWSEAKITNVYWLSTAVVCVIGLLVTYFLF
ncbi:MAG: phospho-N-acetylmuramoyl-pentapeptide-transferase, partial [Methanobrevibacter sp.]|nr:phospho-N-acetylmuramoyl-pentapeptide-transferase [Methanobrevibacter sp.]